MRKRKLKAYVIPTVYTLVVMVVFASLMFMNASFSSGVNEVKKESKESDYVIEEIVPSEIPVLNEVDTSVTKPFNSELVEVLIDYYDKDDEVSKQEKSLFFYKNTYMQSTGIMYGSDSDFEVVSVYSGNVKNVTEDEILGTVIEIEHSKDITTFYYSVKDVLVKTGDKLEKGAVIAKGGSSSLENLKTNNLLFEVYKSGKLIDPNSFYELDMEK